MKKGKSSESLKLRIYICDTFIKLRAPTLLKTFCKSPYSVRIQKNTDLNKNSEFKHFSHKENETFSISKVADVSQVEAFTKKSPWQLKLNGDVAFHIFWCHRQLVSI